MKKQEISDLIERGDLDGALEMLKKIIPDGTPNRNLLVNLSSQLSGLNRNVSMGIIRENTAIENLKNIRNAVINLLNDASRYQKKQRTILFLGASPKELDVTRIGEEHQRIKDTLRAASTRDEFRFESEMAAQIGTLTKALQEYEPAVVHFSGHGSGTEGLSFEDEYGEEMLYPISGLNRLFRLVDEHVECVVLNACYASEQAKVISQHDIFVIGMNGKIPDAVAIKFSVGFYQSLGEGRPYEYAFEIGMTHIAQYADDADKPELWKDQQKIR